MMGHPDDCPFAIVTDKSEYVRKLVQATTTLNAQARELKSVQLDAPAGAVRLLLHAPHANRYNTSAQVLVCAAPSAGFDRPVHRKRQHPMSRCRASAGVCYQLTADKHLLQTQTTSSWVCARLTEDSCQQVGIVALNLIGVPLAEVHTAANGIAHPAAAPAKTRDPNSGGDAGGLDAETATQVLLHHLCS